MNVRDVVCQLGLRYWDHGQSPLVTDGWCGVVCPYCDGGRGRPGLGIHLRSLRASCWRCGGHNLAAALAAASGRSVGAVRALLGGLVPEGPSATAVQGILRIPDGVGPLLGPHRDYLAHRGFDPDRMAAEYGLGGFGPMGRYKWRIFIPVTGPDGAVVSWTTRAIGDVPHAARYRGARRADSAVPRGAVLAGAHRAGHAVVATEGFFGAAAVGPGAVWTAGVGFSRAQVRLLAAYPVRVLLFDNDPPAQRRASDLADLLACFDGETYVARTAGADPDTAPAAELAEIRARFLQ